MSMEKILTKIRNLLDLARNNSNEHEAMSAALKAQELMAKYNLDIAKVEGVNEVEEITEAIYSPNKKAHYVSKWKYRLASIIARNFCCEIYSLGRSDIVFHGYKKDCMIAKEVFGFLFETGNKLANKHYLKCKKEGKNTKGILNTYLAGFCDGIAEILDKQCTALMLVTPKEVTESFKERVRGCKTITSSLKITDDSNTYNEGKNDGRTVASARALES